MDYCLIVMVKMKDRSLHLYMDYCLIAMVRDEGQVPASLHGLLSHCDGER